MSRNSSSVREASDRTVTAIRLVAGSSVCIWIAPAWTAIRLTWWETTSCISRAMRVRSSTRTSEAMRARSLRRICSRSRMRSDSSRRVRTSNPKAIGAAA